MVLLDLMVSRELDYLDYQALLARLDQTGVSVRRELLEGLELLVIKGFLE